MDNTGYIKLHRNILDSEIFNSADILQMWIWCLCKASFKDKKALIGNSTVDLKAGQFVCGSKAGAVVFETSESTFHRRLKILEELGCISLNPTNKFTIVTVNNWCEYQATAPDNSEKVRGSKQYGLGYHRGKSETIKEIQEQIEELKNTLDNLAKESGD